VAVATAEDSLPGPRVAGPQMLLLADILEHAGYRSAVARPVRVGRRDVGLMLFGAFSRQAWQACRRNKRRRSTFSTLNFDPDFQFPAPATLLVSHRFEM